METMVDLIIIGGGPAGYTAAERAAQKGKKVILFEKNSLGGVCLNEGCIPTKTLLYSAKIWDMAKGSSKYGVDLNPILFDLPKVIARKKKVVRKLVAGIKQRMFESGVEVIPAQAEIQSHSEDIFTVQADGIIYQSAKVLVCAGSIPVIPPIKGVDQFPFWTHKEALETVSIPESLLIVGAGVIGMEFASFFRSLGTAVTMVELQKEILPGFDLSSAQALREEYQKKGIVFLLSSKVLAITATGAEIETPIGERLSLPAEKVLLSVGRRPQMEGWGYHNLCPNESGKAMTCNEFMESSIEGLFVAGDINGVSMLAHTAVTEAETAIDVMWAEKRSMSYKAIPAVVYTSPELASVGSTEEMLQKEGISYHKSELPFTYSGRFVAENEGVTGFCKILSDHSGQILGIHLLGNPASELISIGAMAIECGMTLEQFHKITFAHPSCAEILKEVAGHPIR